MKPKALTLEPVVESSNPRAYVVFVHGLDGDAFKTWRLQADESWPQWIKDATSSVTVRSVNYQIASSAWFGGSIALADRAVSVLELLDVELSNKDIPIVFICHSYGGLLVKEMLRMSKDVAPQYCDFYGRVKAIIFFATPHKGSSIPNYLKNLDVVLGAMGVSPLWARLLRQSRAITELKTNESNLRVLDSWFRQHIDPAKVRLVVYFESWDTYGVRVVDETSADPNIKDVTPVALDADHITICKPEKPDLRVKRTIQVIKSVTGEEGPKALGPTAVARILQAPDKGHLRYLREEFQRRLAANPGDRDAMEGVSFLRKIAENIRLEQISHPTIGPGDRGLLESLLKYFGDIVTGGLGGLVRAVLTIITSRR